MNKIDLSCIVGSQVLCEFSFNNGMSYVSFLKEIKSEADMESARVPKYNSCYGWADNCRIYQHKDYWISNADGKLVLPDGLRLNVVLRNEAAYEGSSEGSHFEHIHELNDIIAVQVTGVADGWEW